MKLIILDRDGVINQDSDNYIKSPSEWTPIPGSLQAIAALKATGWIVTVATNQSGLARGLFDVHTLDTIHETLHSQLAKLHVEIDYITFCPHNETCNCNCRKPKPGMFQEIAEHFNCSLQNIPVIGDSLRDLEAAVAVKAQPILVKTGKGLKAIENGKLPKETLIYDDLSSVVTELLRADSR